MAKLGYLSKSTVGTEKTGINLEPKYNKMEPVKPSLKFTLHNDAQEVTGVIQIFNNGVNCKDVNVTVYAYHEVSKEKKEGWRDLLKNVVLPSWIFDAINEDIFKNIQVHF